MWNQSMDQNSFFLDAIDQEAINNQADTHHQNCLPSNDIMPKSTFKSYVNNISLCKACFKFCWPKILKVLCLTIYV